MKKYLPLPPLVFFYPQSELQTLEFLAYFLPLLKSKGYQAVISETAFPLELQEAADVCLFVQHRFNENWTQRIEQFQGKVLLVVCDTKRDQYISELEKTLHYCAFELTTTRQLSLEVAFDNLSLQEQAKVRKIGIDDPVRQVKATLLSTISQNVLLMSNYSLEQKLKEANATIERLNQLTIEQQVLLASHESLEQKLNDANETIEKLQKQLSAKTPPLISEGRIEYITIDKPDEFKQQWLEQITTIERSCGNWQGSHKEFLLVKLKAMRNQVDGYCLIRKNETYSAFSNFVKLFHDLLDINTIIQEHYNKSVYGNLSKELKSILFEFCFNNIRVMYDVAVASCLRNPDFSSEKSEISGYHLLSLNIVYMQLNAELQNISCNEKYQQKCKDLFQKIKRLIRVYHPDSLGFNEFAYHVERRNQKAAMAKVPYHGQLIYDLDAYKAQIESIILDELLLGITKIKDGTLPRTQFHIDMAGQIHSALIDVAWKNNQFEMIFIDSSTECMQKLFLLRLMAPLMALGRFKIIAIWADVQKDKVSCYTYTYEFGKILSKTTFAELAGKESIPYPTMFNGEVLIPADVEKELIDWKPITVLGKKAVLMNQSLTAMTTQLKKLYGDDNTVQAIIDDAKIFYSQKAGKKETSIKDKFGEHAYIQYKRHRLRQKATGEYQANFSLKSIREETKAESNEQALRRLASGQYLSRMDSVERIKYMLKTDPTLLEKASEGQEMPPLHWAYKKGQIHAIDVLRKHGADKFKNKSGISAQDINPKLKY